MSFSLYFAQFSEEQKLKVWEHFLYRAKRDFLIDSEDLREFGRMLAKKGRSMNGREIRNIWQTATSLAVYEHQSDSDLGLSQRKPLLSIAHFEMIEQAAAKFDDYMAAVKGDSEPNRARMRDFSSRIDDFISRDDDPTSSQKPNPTGPQTGADIGRD